jgi:hypothetical protein
MTCRRMLALMDAVPRSEWTAAEREAAKHHMDECARCRGAKADVTALETGLAGLPEPAVPDGLTTAVMARIARVGDARERAVAEGAQRAETRSVRRAGWWALAGQAAGLAALAFLAVRGGVPPDLTSPRIGLDTSSVVPLPEGTLTWIVLATGFLLYIAGLFAPLRRGGPGPSSPRTAL